MLFCVVCNRVFRFSEMGFCGWGCDDKIVLFFYCIRIFVANNSDLLIVIRIFLIHFSIFDSIIPFYFYVDKKTLYVQ